jgi:hypothetical protein
MSKTTSSENSFSNYPHQLLKLTNPIIHLPNDVTLLPVNSAHNLGVLSDSNLTFSQHISAVSKSRLYYIGDLRRICNTINRTTAGTVAISPIYSTLDFCNSLPLNLSLTQTQLVINATAHVVTQIENKSEN